MGAWGLLFDENDDAADWLADFADSSDWALVDAAFDLDEDYIEAPEASSALAAAEIVAATKGSPSDRLPEAIRSWAAEQAEAGSARAAMAASAIQRIRDDSELSELWEDSDEFEDWKKSINETLTRL